MNEKLKPVQTRKDCIEWLDKNELDGDLFAAYRGAQKYFEDYDFSSDPPNGFDKLNDGTVVSEAHGEPVVNRQSFLETFLMFFVWRVRGTAERLGVPLKYLELDYPPDAKTFDQAIKNTHWEPWLSATVTSVRITKEQFKTLPLHVQNAARKAAKSGKVFVEKI